MEDEIENPWIPLLRQEQTRVQERHAKWREEVEKTGEKHGGPMHARYAAELQVYGMMIEFAERQMPTSVASVFRVETDL